MLGQSLFGYIWQTSRNRQIQICVLASLVAPLSTLPLELQRRIVDHTVSGGELWLLALLGVMYLVILLIQGAVKYVLNLMKGRVLEEIVKDLRIRILDRVWTGGASSPGQGSPRPGLDAGTTVSMLASESEDIGGFAAESLSVPLLQASTILWVMGYLIWVEPQVAALATLIYAPQVFLVPRIQGRINALARRKTQAVRKLGHDAVMGQAPIENGHSWRRARAGLLVTVVFKIRMMIYRKKFFLTFLGNFLDSLGPLIVLVAGGYLVIRGQTNVSTLVVFISGFQRLSDPWDQLITFYRSISNARITFGLVAEALEGAVAAAAAADGTKRIRWRRAAH